MRHWKSALEQIYDHNANKALPLYASRTDTEKALIDALKELELQCKERIDLLEALRVSRQENAIVPPPAPTPSSGKLTKTIETPDSGPSLKGSIGQGTIPAVTYSELSRPAVPQKPANLRPPMPARPSSDASMAGSTSRNGDLSTNLLAPVQKVSSNGKSPDNSSAARSPSPDKYTMRTTLRSGKPSDKPPRSSRKSSKPAAEGPSKAATLAWSSLTSRERLARNTSQDSAKPPTQRHSSDQPRQVASSSSLQWDSHSRRLVAPRVADASTGHGLDATATRHSDDYPRPSYLSVSAASSALNYPPTQDSSSDQSVGVGKLDRANAARITPSKSGSRTPRLDPGTTESTGDSSERKRTVQVPMRKRVSAVRPSENPRASPKPVAQANRPRRRERPSLPQPAILSSDSGDEESRTAARSSARRHKREEDMSEDLESQSSADSLEEEEEEDQTSENALWKKKKESILKNLPPGVDESAAKQILNDIIVQGDEVRWSDIAGLDVAKNALREAVVYPFLRPDLFMGLREPARGMLLFGPPGTGKTMLARAVATESRSTFFSISASSLTSKFLGESEKLVRALFGLAKVLAPSIIFVDEIDSLLSQRSGSGEHEATRRIKTEFLIQWSDLQRAAAGRETTERDKERGDANRVLVLAATNLPWAIDEAARRRFVRRQYIPLPEATTRETQLRTLLGQQKHHLSDVDISELVELTDGKDTSKPLTRAPRKLFSDVYRF